MRITSGIFAATLVFAVCSCQTVDPERPVDSVPQVVVPPPVSMPTTDKMAGAISGVQGAVDRTGAASGKVGRTVDSSRATAALLRDATSRAYDEGVKHGAETVKQSLQEVRQLSDKLSSELEASRMEISDLDIAIAETKFALMKVSESNVELGNNLKAAEIQIRLTEQQVKDANARIAIANDQIRNANRKNEELEATLNRERERSRSLVKYRNIVWGVLLALIIYAGVRLYLKFKVPI